MSMVLINKEKKGIISAMLFGLLAGSLASPACSL